jgi:hypothetical protein
MDPVRNKSVRWFVLQRDGETHLLSWQEYNRDWHDAGFELVDWFRAPNEAVARVKMTARGKQRGYLVKGCASRESFRGSQASASVVQTDAQTKLGAHLPVANDQPSFARIPRYTRLRLGEPIEEPRVYAGETLDGRSWACKSVGPNRLFSECLGFRFAEVFDVRVPDFAVCNSDEDYWLTSIVWPSTHCDPARCDEISNFQSLGRLLVLDLFVGNFDRHERNLLIDQATPTLAWGIDFEKAWAGQPGTFEPKKRFVPSQTYVTLPTEMYLSHANEFVAEAIELIDLHIASILQESEEVADLGIPCEYLENDLRERADLLPELLADFEGQL